MALFKIENLSFTYPDAECPSLDGVSLEINEGETVAVIGESGSGKSTLLRLLKPSVSPKGEKSGEISFFEDDIELKTGFLFQNPYDQSVCDRVSDELMFSLKSFGLSREEIKLRTAEIVEFFGLGDILHRQLCSLSGGEVQLVNLASAAALSPKVIILDEPYAQLDPVSCERLTAALIKLKNELGAALVIATHTLENILGITDKLLVLEGGRAKAFGECDKTLLWLKAEGSALFKTAGDLAFLSDKKIVKTQREAREILKGGVKYTIRDKKAPEGERTVRLKNVYFRYEKNLPDVLKAADFEARKGSIVGLCGSNGSGKTTLLTLIAEANKPYSGRVKLSGHACFIPQDARCAFYKESVGEDIQNMCCELKISEEDIENDISRYPLFRDIKAIFPKHPYDLSGGELQKAAVFKAVLSGREIILLDEPAKGLDPRAKENLAALLSDIKKDKTVIISSHDMGFLAAVCDETAMLFDGEVVSVCAPLKFMQKNRFFTTSLARASRGIADGLIIASQLEAGSDGEK